MRIFLILFLALTLAPAGAFAARSSSGDKPDQAAMYRYQTKSGQTVISSTLSDEAIYAGYEVLDQQGRVIRKVPAAPTPEERKKLKAQKQAQQNAEEQKKKDKKLLELYAGPEDAVRARDRQIQALKLKISYTKNNEDQVNKKLEEEVSAASKFERQGHHVPKSIQRNIDLYQQQIKDLESKIDQYKGDIADVRKEFQPIIQRLRVITGDDGKASATDPGASKDASTGNASVPEDNGSQ